MTSLEKSYPFFIMVLAVFCLFYLGCEFLTNHYTMLAVDEFWFAHRIYQYKDALPYLDFAPYKTVLGYYFLLPPLLIDRDILPTLIFTKDIFALANMLILFVSSLWLIHHFSRVSVLISLAILITAEIVLSYSTQIRVDLIGYWFCFFSLLMLMERKYLLAGILIGLGFACTQKTVWYIFASNCALGMYWLTNARRINIIKDILIFNLSCACVIGLYLGFWSWLSDWNTVINSVFHEASAMYRLDWYDATRKLFWRTIILYNPLLFLLWPITLLSLFVTYDQDKNYQSRLFVVTYSIVILLCLIPYKQVFPYYMQVTIPVFFVLYAAFADWLIGLYKSKTIPQYNLALLIALALYIAGIIALVVALNLPTAYFFICAIPLSLMIYLVTAAKDIFKIIIITVVFFSFVYPLALLPGKWDFLDNKYQQANIQAINTLLKEGGDYVAGIELIYNKTQTIAGLRHLMAPAIQFLYKPDDKLKEVMLASLYEDPNATPDTVINALKQSSVKFYVNNYRMHELPTKIKEFLASQYAHWWGSIYLYAPLIPQGQHTFIVKFTGKYLIDTSSNRLIEINGHRYEAHSIVSLQKGKNVSNAGRDYRLKLIPTVNVSDLNPAFKNDDWDKLIF